MRTGIRFYLGANLVQLTEFDPQMTVLQWLRRDMAKTGTKEGCSEGDCGACSVLVGRLILDDVRYRAMNACIQPLATLDGCHLITIEHVARPDGSLHPVQRAMVDAHGSQCGYCTPGFVMTMLALYKEGQDLSAWSLEDVLAGNLCRCTGYGPILDAAKSLNDLRDEQLHPFRDNAQAQLAELRDEETFAVTQGERSFISPATLHEFLVLIEQHPNATLIAGATDTGLWVTKQHRDLGTQIWLGRIEALQSISDEENRIVIGAGVNYSDSHAAIAKLYPDMGELWRRIGSVLIRNAGTVGGNVANGSPIGDTPPPLIAAGAMLRLANTKGKREIPLENFFIDYGKQDLREGEVVEAIILPKPEPNWRFRCYKISKRFDQDISAVCGAFNINIRNGKVEDARIAFGGMAATPKRASHAEMSLIGSAWSRDVVEMAMAALARDFKPISDMRAGADYRLKIARNLLLKCFIETSGAERLRLANGAADAA